MRQLFTGSGPCAKYASHAPAYVGGVKFGGMMDDGKTMRTYSDLPVESSATHLIRDRARIVELKPLHAEAKAEWPARKKQSPREWPHEFSWQ